MKELIDWQYLEKEIYFSDGSLRDILVLDASRSDWQKWMSFINENFETKFSYFNEDGELMNSNQIIEKYVFDYWDNVSEYVVNATISMDDIILKCYFFTEQEIENDIAPKEIKGLNHHNQLVDYLIGVSNLLNKEVILTTENYSTDYNKLIIVNNDRVFIK